jgi:hypothetical protein
VAGYSFPATLLFVRCTVCLYPPHMRTIGVVLRRPKVLICLFVGVSVAAFLVPVDVISAHEGDEGSVVVHVTDEGFEPRSVEI